MLYVLQVTGILQGYIYIYVMYVLQVSGVLQEHIYMYCKDIVMYCMYSRYLVYCKKHLSERIIWFLLCLAGLAAAIVLMVLGTTEFRFGFINH